MNHVYRARSPLLLMAMATVAVWGCGETKKSGEPPPCEGRCQTYSGGSAVLAGNIKVNDPTAPDAATPDLTPPDIAQDTTNDTEIPDAPLGPVNNATCGSPKEISLSTSPVTLSGTTKGAANELGDAINCGTGLTFDGPQRYFRASLQGGTTYTVTLKSTGWDAALYIFWDKSCSASTINKQCASYISDASSGPGTETLTVKPSATADFVFVVDSFDPASSGPFTLTLSWQI